MLDRKLIYELNKDKNEQGRRKLFKIIKYLTSKSLFLHSVWSSSVLQLHYNTQLQVHAYRYLQLKITKNSIKQSLNKNNKKLKIKNVST